MSLYQEHFSSAFSMQVPIHASVLKQRQIQVLWGMKHRQFGLRRGFEKNDFKNKFNIRYEMKEYLE